MDLPTTKISRVAVYARVSSDEQREGQTIDSQVDEVRRFAEQRGWALSEVYKDEGWSGSILGRPELDRLRDDATRHLFDAVLINDVDRLARDVTHLGVIKRDLLRHGVTLIFRKLPNDNSPTNNLLVNILGSFAEFERELITDRTRRGRRYKVETRQRFIGCIAPYGYRYVPQQHSASGEGDLDVLPSEAAVVKEMYRWVDHEGLSARQVVVRLNERQIAPRSGRRLWQRSSVLRILRREMYAGVWYYNKQELRHHSEDVSGTPREHRVSLRLRPRSGWIPVTLPESLRIIDRRQWERVQRQLDENFAFSPRHSKHSYLLRGLMRCGACSTPYIGEPCHGRFYYRCSSRCGKSGMLREELLNGTVWSAVVGIVTDPTLIASRLATLIERRRTQVAQPRDRDLATSRAIARLATEEDQLIVAYRTGAISAQALAQELEKINEQRTVIQKPPDVPPDAEQLREIDSRAESVVDFLNYAAAQLSRFTDGQRQRFLRLLIRSIRIEDHRIRIIGRIPSADEVPQGDSLWQHSAEGRDDTTASDGGPTNNQAADAVEELSCRIAPTEAGLRGHNTGAEFQAIVRLDTTRPQQPRDGKTGQYASPGKSAAA